MKLRIALLVFASGSLISCSSNEELQKRMDDRNDAYYNLQERREIRQDARDDRYDAHWDRVMN